MLNDAFLCAFLLFIYFSDIVLLKSSLFCSLGNSFAFDQELSNAENERRSGKNTRKLVGEIE